MRFRVRIRASVRGSGLPRGESAIERVAGARERHGAVADAADHQGSPRGGAK